MATAHSEERREVHRVKKSGKRQKKTKKQRDDSLVIAKKSRESGPVPLLQPCSRLRYCIITSRRSGIRFRECTENRKFTLLPESCYNEFELYFLAFCSDVCLAMDCWPGFEDFQLGAYPL